jgi:Hemerythrin HHE cation binding domain
MADLVIVLARQHAQCQGLLASLARQPPVSDHIHGPDLRRRHQLVERIRREFAAQELAKQRYLWPLIRGAWPDGDAVAAASVRQKRRCEELLIKLRWLGDRDEIVNKVVSGLIAALGEYIGLEDGYLSRLHHTVGEDILEAAGTRLARPRRLPVTRPHPDLPASPRAARLLGLPLAVVDHVIDAFVSGPSAS